MARLGRTFPVPYHRLRIPPPEPITLRAKVELTSGAEGTLHLDGALKGASECKLGGTPLLRSNGKAKGEAQIESFGELASLRATGHLISKTELGPLTVADAFLKGNKSAFKCTVALVCTPEGTLVGKYIQLGKTIVELVTECNGNWFSEDANLKGKSESKAEINIPVLKAKGRPVATVTSTSETKAFLKDKGSYKTKVDLVVNFEIERKVSPPRPNKKVPNQLIWATRKRSDLGVPEKSTDLRPIKNTTRLEPVPKETDLTPVKREKDLKWLT